MKKGKSWVRPFGNLLLLVVVLTMTCGLHPVLAGAAEINPLPRSIVIATHAVGSGFHADGSAVAKVVSEKSPVNMVVGPHPGPPAWLPAMNNGEIEFGVLVGSDGATAYRGIGSHRRAYPNIRLPSPDAFSLRILSLLRPSYAF